MPGSARVLVGLRAESPAVTESPKTWLAVVGRSPSGRASIRCLDAVETSQMDRMAETDMMALSRTGETAAPPHEAVHSGSQQDSVGVRPQRLGLVGLTVDFQQQSLFDEGNF